MQLSYVTAEYAEQYYNNYTDIPTQQKKDDYIKYVTISRTRIKHCDMVRELYTFHPDRDVVFNMTAHGCERPYVVLPIPASNLVLVVINNLCPRNVTFSMSVDPIKLTYEFEPLNISLACFKNENEFSRTRPVSCINSHVNVSNFIFNIF